MNHDRQEAPDSWDIYGWSHCSEQKTPESPLRVNVYSDIITMVLATRSQSTRLSREGALRLFSFYKLMTVYRTIQRHARESLLCYFKRSITISFLLYLLLVNKLFVLQFFMWIWCVITGLDLLYIVVCSIIYKI